MQITPNNNHGCYNIFALPTLCVHKCCGCYGPKNGKKQYCTTGCTSQNGGTINRNVYSWFWVRSALPKLLWSKCMEYKVIENGAPVWYKLTGDKLLPLKVNDLTRMITVLDFRPIVQFTVHSYLFPSPKMTIKKMKKKSVLI